MIKQIRSLSQSQRAVISIVTVMLLTSVMLLSLLNTASHTAAAPSPLTTTSPKLEGVRATSQR